MRRSDGHEMPYGHQHHMPERLSRQLMQCTSGEPNGAVWGCCAVGSSKMPEAQAEGSVSVFTSLDGAGLGQHAK